MRILSGAEFELDFRIHPSGGGGKGGSLGDGAKHGPVELLIARTLNNFLTEHSAVFSDGDERLATGCSFQVRYKTSFAITRYLIRP